MNENRFNDDLRRKEQDFEIPAPEGLWADVDRNLAPTPAARFMPRRVRYAAAAALILLIAGTAALILTSPEPHPAFPPVAATGQEQAAVESKNIAKVEKVDYVAFVDYVDYVDYDRNDRSDRSEKSDRSDKGEKGEKGEAESKPESEAPAVGIVAEKADPPTRDYPHITFAKHKTGISVSLFAGNLMADAGGLSTGFRPMAEWSSNGGSSMSDPAIGGIDNPAIMSYARQVRTKTRHNLPLRFGVNVSFPLSGRLSLESGLTYSILSSTTTSGSDTRRDESHQRLHYIGIPLRLRCDIWSTGRLGIYASGGGMAEKCVYGRRTDTVEGRQPTTQNVSESRLQFSVAASAGILYSITRSLDLFVEPGASYHFDNGSSVKNSYKDRPLNFDLKAGVRFNISK